MEISKSKASFKSSFKQFFSTYNYFYLFVIMIYCGMASPVTQNLRGYSGYIIGFVFPLILTFFFVKRNKVRLTRNALYLLLGYGVWFLIQHIKYDSSNLSLTFFMFYQLAIAYSLVYVFRERLLIMYENIIYVLSCICLVTWGIGFVFPTFFDLFSALSLPTSSNIIKYNFVCFSVLDRLVDTGTFYRNPGFLWEPGVYSCYLCFAILANFLINSFKGNRRLYILVLALVTTFSTTGYSILLCTLVPLYMLNKNRKYFVRTLLLIIPLGIFVFSLDFMGEKLTELQANEEKRTEIIESIDFSTSRGYTYTYVPQRFDGLAFEWMNIQNDPLIGYGVHPKNSYIVQTFGERLALSNGLFKLYAQYGLVFGLLLTLCYWRGFQTLFVQSGYKGVFFAFLLFLLASVSYVFYNSPIILAFLLYGVVNKKA